MNDVQKEEFRILQEFDRICQKHKLQYSLAYGTLIGAIRHKGFIPWDDDIDVIMHREHYDKFVRIVRQELTHDMIYVDHEQEKKYYYGFAKIRSKNLNYPEKSTEYLGINQGVWIDIFPFDAIGDVSLIESKKQFNTIKRIHNFFVLSVFTHPNNQDSGYKNVIRSVLYKINNATQNITILRSYMYKKMVKIGTKKNSDSAIRHNCIMANLSNKEFNGGVLTKEQLNNFVLREFEGVFFPVIKDYDAHLTGIYGDYLTLPEEQDRVSNHSIT